MCLAVPVQVIEIKNEDTVFVGTDASKLEVSTLLLSTAPKVGDYAIVHAGFILRILDVHEAEETLKLFQQIAELPSTGMAF